MNFLIAKAESKSALFFVVNNAIDFLGEDAVGARVDADAV